jgi:hypothetical protein
MNAATAGIVYVAITLDADTHEVISFFISMVANAEALPLDTEFLIHVVIGRFYIDTDGTPITFNDIVGNINFTAGPTINAAGRLCMDLFQTYTRDPIPQDFLSLEVFGSGTGSEMYLSVGDSDPSADRLLFLEGENVLSITWTGDGPGMYMYDGTMSSNFGAQHMHFAVGPNAIHAPEARFYNDGAWTWELPNDGTYNVGDSDLTSGDIDLGPSGSVTINGVPYDPQTFTAFDSGMNSFAMTVIGTPPDYAGSTTLMDSLSSAITDMINSAIEGLSWSATCNGDGTITITAN